MPPARQCRKPLVVLAACLASGCAAHARDAAAVVATWRRYVASKDGHYAVRAAVPSPEWVADEQRRWPGYDLVAFYLPDGTAPELVRVEREGAEYRLTARYRVAGAPPMTVTTYAARDGGRWRLANALPRLTRAWRRDTVGAITYVFPPDYPYDRARARRAAAFVDSVAAAFDVPPPGALTYYLARTVDEAYAILGLDWGVRYGAVGGASQPVNRLLLSGIPALGEAYRHELAHMVLKPLVGPGTRYVVSEGVATWLGGTTGMDYPAATRALAACLDARPTVTLDSVLAATLPAPRTYAGGAVLVAMAHERGGVAAVRALFDGGATAAELRATVERLLGAPWPAVRDAWRSRVASYAAAPDTPAPSAPCAP